MKWKPAPRDLYIHKMGKSLHDVLKHMRESTVNCIQCANDERLMSLPQFVGVEAITCRTYNVTTGELIEFSLVDWLLGGYYRR